ncbi:nuclear envelope integral membrane protein 1 isoform X1 [Cucumis melo var. makuwa]|uniref:Nuclear envelope integral membrane protein 1 isoform X1 n=2 Tax=Cucumis melo TaxID=3656 RepID=A0A5D3CFA7_CUCMM|nr:nuclear envelope integral membrane protein 1 isoform X1 [Cucumis melo var. makuwa]TYK10657.1 nuclear envelope integral membrane protein 1 isoform X1 [Cucumis melo var. makuwa]
MASTMKSKIFKFQLNLFQPPNETPKHLIEYTLTDSLQPCSSFTHDDVYPSMFHSTHERRKLSKDEWERLTKDSTKKALEELVSSPDFTRWLLDNAGRINIPPPHALELGSVESDFVGSHPTDKVSLT